MRYTMHRLRGALLLTVVGLLVAACGSSGSSLQGVYAVTSVDGGPLPGAWSEGMRLREGGLMLKDGRYVAMLDLVSADEEAEPLRVQDGGSYHVQGDAVRFQSDQAAGGAVAQWLPVAVALNEGQVDGETLTITLRGHSVVLTRTQP